MKILLNTWAMGSAACGHPFPCTGRYEYIKGLLVPRKLTQPTFVLDINLLRYAKNCLLYKLSMNFRLRSVNRHRLMPTQIGAKRVKKRVCNLYQYCMYMYIPFCTPVLVVG